MQTPELKAGMRLDIVFENEIMKSNAHYMKAVIYECSDDLVTISQTSPALNKLFLNRRLLVTCLLGIERRVLRFGFPGKLMEINPDYQIASGNKVDALLVKKYAALEPTDFRMFFRVKPPSQSDLCLFLQEAKVNLLDISIGGAKFTYPQSHAFQPGDTLKLKLLIGNSIFNLDARVRNIWGPAPDTVNKNIQHVSIEFNHEDKKMETSLSKAIIEIERGLLSEGKI